MKLTKSKILEILRRKNEGWTTYRIKKQVGVSIRRVNQIWTEYQVTGEVPVVGKKMGRPKKAFEPWEVEIISKTYEKYRVSADTLERLINRDYGMTISHNRIHKILLVIGCANNRKNFYPRKIDWIRYERRHSLTAVHIDWHFDGEKRIWVFAVIDDASRKILALIECESPTTDKSIEGMEIALKHGKIKQCISDHGAQFISNIGGDSKFKAYLEWRGIKQILCKIKHPQSNGKVEKWFDMYDNHRHAFNTKEKFLTWYKEVRPHRSLNFQVLETPSQAFERKLKAET
jgi:putative transposase